MAERFHHRDCGLERRMGASIVLTFALKKSARTIIEAHAAVLAKMTKYTIPMSGAHNGDRINSPQVMPRPSSSSPQTTAKIARITASQIVQNVKGSMPMRRFHLNKCVIGGSLFRYR